MPLGMWSIEWLNLNESRAYPLSDAATKRDQTGTFELPDSFLCSLYIPVHTGLKVDPAKFFLRRITVLPTGYNVAIGYDDGTGNPPVVASAVVARSTHVEYLSYALPGVGDFDDVVGKLVIGRIEEIDLQPAGEYTFDAAGGLLDTDCIRPIIRGVSSIAVQNGADVSARIYGDVVLVAGANVEISPVGPGLIRIDAVEGNGLTAACECAGTALPPPIRTINGIPPTVAGDFTFAAGKCLDIEPASAGLQFTNTCGTPCCGCTELAALTAEVEHFGEEGTALRNFVNQMKSEFGKFNSMVLGSRLQDSPCIECP